MLNLTKAIFSKLSGSALSAHIGTRLISHYADEGTTYPYIVYFVVTDIPEYPGGKTIEKFLIQFSLFSLLSGPTEVESMLTDLWTLYDDVVLTVAGYTGIYFIRGILTEMREDHTTPAGTFGVYHYVQEYDGWIVAD